MESDYNQRQRREYEYGEKDYLAERQFKTDREEINYLFKKAFSLLNALGSDE